MDTKLTPWRSLLDQPPRHAHIVQLYESEDFQTEAVAHFAAGGLLRGERVILLGHPGELATIEGRLRGTLPVIPSDRLVLVPVGSEEPRLVVDGRVDVERVRAFVEALAHQANGAATPTRFWGSLVGQLLGAGEVETMVALETIWHAARRHAPWTILCSYSVDKIPGGPEAEVLLRILGNHTHLVPPGELEVGLELAQGVLP